MDDRMKIMTEIQENHPGAYCPSCGAPNKCAIEMGKSSSTCWCMTLDKEVIPDVDCEVCLCRRCLNKEYGI